MNRFRLWLLCLLAGRRTVVLNLRTGATLHVGDNPHGIVIIGNTLEAAP